MPNPPPYAIYAGLPFLTPGAAETVELIAERCGLDHSSRLLEVAYGTGEASMRLAERHGCRAIGVDMHPFAYACASAAAKRGLADRVGFAIGDGGVLPVLDAIFDVAFCIGAPSIVGTERCLAAMHRALRPGGRLAVSDWVWAATPVPSEAVPSGITHNLTLDGYASLIRAAGFDVTYAEPLPQRVWDEYYAPLRENLARLRGEHPGMPAGSIDDELRIHDSGLGAQWARYAVFMARRP